jgi:hypothetical protein
VHPICFAGKRSACPGRIRSAIYNFQSGIWVGLNTAYYTGGRTTVKFYAGTGVQAHRGELRPGGDCLAIPFGGQTSKEGGVEFRGNHGVPGEFEEIMKGVFI